MPGVEEHSVQEKVWSCPSTQGLATVVCVVLAVVIAHMNGEFAASVVSGVS